MTNKNLVIDHFRKPKSMRRTRTKKYPSKIKRDAKAQYVDTTDVHVQKLYVAWIDVMGSGSMMVRSLKNTLNFTLKLQSAAIDSEIANVKLFPMNDGVFAISSSIFNLQNFIVAVYERIYLSNKSAIGLKKMDKVFVARASIAYGPVFDGESVTRECSQILFDNPNFACRILIGPPVINAFRSESYTGPFGIFVHESARLYGPDTWSGSLMRYWDDNNPPEWFNELKRQLTQYFDFAAKHPHELDYPADALKRHRDLAKEFFNDERL